HYMFNRVGGLKEEVPAGWTRRAREAIDLVRRRLPDLDNLIRRNDIFLARTVGVGVLSAADAAAYGASGPVARASGLDFDLRRDGHTYAWTETPLGINGYYLVSRGEKTPWRLKLRTASYANVQALATLLPGCLVPDLIAILGSMLFVVGDIDK